VVTVGFVALGGSGSKAAPSLSSGETIVPGQGGHWTNVTPDQLADMLTHKDFTLVNVKTPYIGEIDGTDLYIPYDQLSARASQLPADKSAKILVYCRSGVESAQAAQTLLNLGYTNVWNLDGGMNAWQSSGRTLVQKNRQ
jgi:rhodanese-related sulfurtransferase